jgi:hypothetical protein
VGRPWSARLIAIALVVLATVFAATARPAQITGAATPEPIVVRGFVFEDRDGDGIQDPDEHGIPSWQFSLGAFAALGYPSHGATSDASGHFLLLMPFTPRVAESFRLVLLPEPPQLPEGYAWVVTFRSRGLNSIPIALNLESEGGRSRNLEPGLVFEAKMGAQLVPDSGLHNVPVGRIPNGREPPVVDTAPRP